MTGIGGGTLYGLVANGVPFGAGAAYRNVPYQGFKKIADFENWRRTSEGEDALLGATVGGIMNHFDIAFDTMDADGYDLIAFKGGRLPAGGECFVTTTLKNATPAVLQAVNSTSRFAIGADAEDNTISMRIATGLDEKDHSDNILTAVTTTFGMLLIAYRNCICSSDGNSLSTVSGNAGGTVGFRAEASAATINDDQILPVEVRFFFKSNEEKLKWAEKLDAHRIYTGE